MANVSIKTFSQYLASRDQVYTATYENWGANVGDQLVFAESVNGIAIAPDSVIDTVYVEYAVDPPGAIALKGGVRTETFALSPSNPIDFRIRGPITIRMFPSTATGTWGLGAYPAAKIISFNSIITGGVIAPYVDAALTVPVMLRLLVAARDRALGGAIPARRSLIAAARTVVVDAGVPTLALLVPVFGRKSAFVEAVAGVNAPGTVDITTVTPFISADGPTQDDTLATTLALAAGGRAQTRIDLNGQVGMLALYATGPGPANGITVKVTATDI